MKRIAIFALALLTGCSFSSPMIMAPANIGPKETAVASVMGTSNGIYILFFGPFGDYSLTAAIHNAEQSVHAENLLNVSADRTLTSFIIFAVITTTVHGTAVIYSEINRPQGPEIKPSQTTNQKPEIQAVKVDDPAKLKKGDPIIVTFTDGTKIDGLFNYIDDYDDTLHLTRYSGFSRGRILDLRRIKKIEKAPV